MRHHLQILFAAAAPCRAFRPPPRSVPEIAFDSVADPLKFPDNIHMGEAAGVATNSKGDIFVYTRTGHPTISIGTSRPFAHGGSRLFQFDKTGKFVREIGQDSYGFLVAQQVRVDPQDNIWVVDQMSSMVIKFDPNGQRATAAGQKVRVGAASGASAAGRGAGAAPVRCSRRCGSARGRGRGGGSRRGPAERPVSTADRCRVGCRRQHLCGRWLRQRPRRQVRQERQVHQVLGIERDRRTASSTRSTESRSTRRATSTSPTPATSEFRSSTATGTSRRRSTNVGTPAAICITPGPHQYLYSSNSNPPEDIDFDGEIYKMELDGKIVGKFGKAGKLPKEFGTVNAIDCRSDNELYVGEIGNWRVQKLTLHSN